MNEDPKPGRVRRRINQIKAARRQSVGVRKRAFAATIIALILGCASYSVFTYMGEWPFDWRLFLVLGGVSAGLGLLLGLTILSRGASVGVLTKVWIFLEIFIVLFLVLAEAIIAALAAIFGAFG